MKTIYFFALISMILLVTPGCLSDFFLEGNGINETEKRITSAFSKISSEGAFNVTVTQGDNFNVLVTAESNLLPYIETEVRGNTLHLFTKRIHSIKSNHAIEINIIMPGLTGVILSGSGIIKTGRFQSTDFNATLSGSGIIESNVEAVTLDATISGSGNLLISGTSEKAKLLLSGSGKISAGNMFLNECGATISGSGNIWVQVEKNLSATIIGSGNIYYSGEPAIETHIYGSGNVIRSK